jgi:all-trans-retinol 13,14-reductase
VISAAGIPTTIKLFDSPPIEWNNIKTTPSCSMFYLFVVLNGTSDELKLPAYNIWSSPWEHGETQAEGLKNFIDNPMERRPPTFISFPGAKDSNYTERHQNNRCSAEILTIMPYEWFEKWQETTLKKRGDDYIDCKKIWEEKLLKELLYFYPHLEDKVYKVISASPLTIQHYYEAVQGAVYGINCDMWRFTPEGFTGLCPDTSIGNFYITGQDIFTCGVSSAFMSGMVTVMSMLKYADFPLGDIYGGKDMLKDWKLRKNDEEKKMK